MNFGHSGLTRWGLDFIDIAIDIDALDIGCGGGRTVERLAGIATDGKVVGIDYSPDAVVVARKKNRALINEGRVEIFQEAVSSMRFIDSAFGLITAVETHYFWPDFRNDLKEVHRVTKQNGQLLIVGAVYKNKKYDRRNQRIVDAIGMTYLGIEEFREILEGVGYLEFDALEEKNKGWFAVKCRKQEGGTV
jgi:SAM-dependent methyltransferase